MAARHHHRRRPPPRRRGRGPCGRAPALRRDRPRRAERGPGSRRRRCPRRGGDDRARARRDREAAPRAGGIRRTPDPVRRSRPFGGGRSNACLGRGSRRRASATTWRPRSRAMRRNASPCPVAARRSSPTTTPARVSASVKLQELFGLAETPRIGPRRVPVLLHLLAPNGRPVQSTSDLRSFWERTYPEVRKELRGRYPKHPWPEDPWTATPTAKTTRGGTTQNAERYANADATAQACGPWP